MMFTLYRCSAFCAALIMFFAAVPTSSADNLYDRHGHNFHYDDDGDTVVMFPVFLDLRRGYYELRNYYRSYGIYSESVSIDSAIAKMEEIFCEAGSCGVNAVADRTELLLMNDHELFEGPSSTDEFVRIAERVRSDNYADLMLATGGYRKRSGLSTTNELVSGYLYDYVDTWEDSTDWQRVIGNFCMDEPDGPFVESTGDPPDFDEDWVTAIDELGSMWRDNWDTGTTPYPFCTAIWRWNTTGTVQDTTATKPLYRYIIPAFCEHLDAVLYDHYCAKVTAMVEPEPSFTNVLFDEVFGATDLIFDSDTDCVYEAYTAQDEVFGLDDHSVFRVYSWENECSTSALELVQRYEYHVDIEDPVWGASDFRAVDVGDRSSNSHQAGGAVAFFNASDPDDNVIFVNDGTGIQEEEIPMPENATAVYAVCVGELNYEAHYPRPVDREGLIGHGALRILVVYGDTHGGTTTTCTKVFEYSGGSFSDCTADDTLSFGGLFTPTGAIWGIFWPEYKYWSPQLSNDQSGFVVFDRDEYAYVYEVAEGDSTAWEKSSLEDWPEGFEFDETAFIARRTWGYPCYVAGVDYICRPQSASGGNMCLRVLTGCGDGNFSDPLDDYTSASFSVPEDFAYSDLTDASSCHPLKGVWPEHLLLSFWDDEVDSSKTFISNAYGSGRIMFQYIIDGDDDPIVFSDNVPDYEWLAAAQTPILGTCRVGHSRRPFRAPILGDPTQQYPNRFLLCFGDLDASEAGVPYFEDHHQAYDTVYTYGIEGTAINNCILNNVRWGGRHCVQDSGEFDWYQTEEQLLYLLVCPLVHGARGIFVRAVGITLLTGGFTDETSPLPFRYPALLQDWGPSLDTEDVDMFSRGLSVLEDLTGEGASGPDFLDALVDTDWAVQDNVSAGNGSWNGDSSRFEAETNNDLNFIALKHSTRGDILMLVVNDSADSVETADGSWIYFKYETQGDYPAIDRTCWAGFDPFLYHGSGPGSSDEMGVNFVGMPPYTASVLELED
jgi:hypothetical protein